MIALDSLIPFPVLVERDHVDVSADAAQSWNLARSIDLADSPLARTLFAVRTIASYVSGREPRASGLTIDDMTGGEGPGFRILSEDPGRELIVGAIGKVWAFDIPFVDISTVEAFSAFGQEGYVKIAWALRVFGDQAGGARVEIELRVAATDQQSRNRFRRYFRVVGPGSRLIRQRALAMLAAQLGRAQDARWAGDELVPDPAYLTHRDIDILAEPEEVWPWLLQMGYHRAGWYMDGHWDARIQKHFWAHYVPQEARPEYRPPLDYVDPRLAILKVGDIVPDGPPGTAFFTVERADSARALCLFSNTHLTFLTPKWLWNTPWRMSGTFSWAFLLDPVGASRTRLTIRMRAVVYPERIGRALAAGLGAADIVHVRSMLRGIKRRVEAMLAMPPTTGHLAF